MIYPIVVGTVLVALFVVRSRRVAYPLLDMNLYRNRAFSAASLATGCLGAALFGASFLIPLYFQEGRGLDPIHTGLLILPQTLGSVVGMLLAGRSTTRLGAGLTALIGTTIMLAFTLPLLFLTDSTSYTTISMIIFVRGFGVGIAIMPSMTAAFSVLTHEQVRNASPQLNVIQRVGGSFGVALVAVSLQSKIVHIGIHATSSQLATAVAQTYWWVAGSTAIALVPNVILWRIERRTRGNGTGTMPPRSGFST